jgi:fructose-bisphosphate aldolase class 1
LQCPSVVPFIFLTHIIIHCTQIVEQQFEFGKKIMAKGLIPILEPEINIKAADKGECEAILRAELHENVSAISCVLFVCFPRIGT